MSDINISRINNNKPSVLMLHSASGKLAVGHVIYWMDILIKSKLNFSILLRSNSSYKKITELYPENTIIYAKSPVHVETAVNAQKKLKLVLYTSNMAINIHLLRFNHLAHVFVGSEYSDYLSKINKSYRAYDEIYVSSQSQVEKYKSSIKNIGHIKFSIVGKPQLKKIFSKPSDLSKGITYISKGKIDSNTSSLKLSAKILFNLSEKINIPVNAFINKNYMGNLTNYTASFEGDVNIVKVEKHTLDLLIPHTKLIITDIDSLSVMFFSYNKPILVYLPEYELIENIPNYIPKDCLYFYKDTNELLDIVTCLIGNNNNDFLEEGKSSVQYLFGKEETMKDGFYKAIESSLRK